jgi:hypothetical protein
MRRVRVDSSAIRSAGFDAEHNVLELEFESGAIYDYFGVPRRLYDHLLGADSKGAFVNREIVPRFPARKVN